jgi:hypothetical protein
MSLAYLSLAYLSLAYLSLAYLDRSTVACCHFPFYP